MSADTAYLFWWFSAGTLVLLTVGFYCVLATYNLIRALIGLEILIKAVTLFIIAAGYITGHQALAQSLVITLIVIEVVVITVSVGIVLNIHSHNDSLDARNIRNLKG